MNLIEKIKKINNKNILVIGDIMLDSYFFGSSQRISPEAPVPILLEKSTKKVLGGAANVALNLVSAGSSVSMMSVVGDDIAGSYLLNTFKENNINCNYIEIDKERCTTVKNRYIGQNNMQMFRFDQENTNPINDNITNNLLFKLEKDIKNFDLIIISDYKKGFLTVNNTQKFIDIANKNNIKVLVDIKEPIFDKYKNAYLIKPNLSELHEITKMSVNTFEEIIAAGKYLQEKTNCKYVLVTRGSDGMTLINNNEYHNFKCKSREVYDVTGAGDTVISYLSIGLSNEYSIEESCNIANYAAAVKVSKMGTYAVKPQDIIEYLYDEYHNYDDKKVVTADELENILKNNQNKKVVFTNGCFDIFHVGHLRYLKETSKYGDILVVGVNSDKSVKRLKGNNRPIVSEDERMELLAALNFVSYVVKFDEDTPYELIKKIKPDIITKGGDYNPNDVVGKDIVLAKGGKVIICPLVENKSTTNIIEKILEVYHE